MIRLERCNLHSEAEENVADTSALSLHTICPT